MKKLLVAVLVGAAIWYAQAKREPAPVPDTAAAPLDSRDLQPERDIARAFSPVPTGNFSCDGRTRCSQMRSCEEADFFLKHCPDVKMDGDRDGLPCEDHPC